MTIILLPLFGLIHVYQEKCITWLTMGICRPSCILMSWLSLTLMECNVHHPSAGRAAILSPYSRSHQMRLLHKILLRSCTILLILISKGVFFFVTIWRRKQRSRKKMWCHLCFLEVWYNSLSFLNSLMNSCLKACNLGTHPTQPFHWTPVCLQKEICLPSSRIPGHDNLPCSFPDLVGSYF